MQNTTAVQYSDSMSNHSGQVALTTQERTIIMLGCVPQSLVCSIFSN